MWRMPLWRPYEQMLDSKIADTNNVSASAFAGVFLYALACIVDHADGELARLTFQESRIGANLDWTIDTLIHAGLVLGIGVSDTAALASTAMPPWN